MYNSENSKYLSNFSTAKTNYYSWTHWCLVESFVCSEWNTRSKPTEEGSKLEIMPRFLAITVAKLCSAILEVRLASYRLDGNILSCALYLNSQTWLPLVANFLSLWRYSEWQWFGMTIMPRFLAITVAKLCSAILEVRLASYCLDGNILSWLDVINLCTLIKLSNMAASCGQFLCPCDISKLTDV